MSQYQNINVETAKRLALEFNKDQIVIIGWSNEHNRFHTATYGVSPSDKVTAGRNGQLATEACGADIKQGVWYEDFRSGYDAAKQKAMLEAIEKHLPELKQLATAGNSFETMVKDFEKSLS